MKRVEHGVHTWFESDETLLLLPALREKLKALRGSDEGLESFIMHTAVQNTSDY